MDPTGVSHLGPRRPPAPNPVASQIEYLQRRAKSSGRDIRFLVLDLSAVPHIDGPAVHFLKGLVYEQSKKGVQVPSGRLP